MQLDACIDPLWICSQGSIWPDSNGKITGADIQRAPDL